MSSSSDEHKHSHHHQHNVQVTSLPQRSFAYSPQRIIQQSTVIPATTGLVGSTVIQAPVQATTVPTTQYVGTSQIVGATLRESIKGESRIEYVPYEKSVIEYEAVQRVEYVPKEKKVTDYYAVEYQTEYIPQVYQDKYIEYIPQERVAERVEYQAVERQVVHPPVVEQQVQTIQYVPQEVKSVQYVQQPVVTSQVQYVPQPVTQTIQTVGQVPLQYSRIGATVNTGAPLSASQIKATNLQTSQFVYPATTSVFRQGPVFTSGAQVIPQGVTRVEKHKQHAKKEEKGFLEKLFD